MTNGVPNGMGQGTNRVTTEPNSGIMFVEMAYDYQPMVFDALIPNKRIIKTAAMYVRDKRDYASGVVATAGIPPALCTQPTP